MRFILKHRLPIAAGFFCLCLLFAAAPSQTVGADRVLLHPGDGGGGPVVGPDRCCNCTIHGSCPCNLVSGFVACTITQTPDGRSCTTVGHAQCLVQGTGQ